MCTSLNWSANLVVGATFPAMLGVLGIGGSYLIFAAANVAAAVFLAGRLVETKQRTVAEIQAQLAAAAG